VLLELLCLILGTSIAFNGMMFLLMVRVDDPLTPRAMFGVLNMLLFYPSGAMYPIASFPWWLRAISVVDPFTYCIHGFKAICSKTAASRPSSSTCSSSFVFGIGTLLIATPLFKRTL
jgi:ABC-2 type transport system permease protein